MNVLILISNACTWYLLLIDSDLETLPNELMFVIISYLSSLDTIQAFYGLHQRFSSIVLESVRHFILPRKTSIDRILRYIPFIENFIETLIIDVQLIPSVFSCRYSYRKLHSIILKCSDVVTVELKVDNICALDAIDSCLNLFQLCRIVSFDEETHMLHCCDNHSQQIYDEQVCKINHWKYSSFK